MKKGIVLLLIVLMVSSFAFAQGSKEATEVKTEGPMKVGVIYISPPGDMGYSFMHDQGTIALEKHFGDKVKVTRLENIAENENSERAMENLIEEGCKIIFANSYNYQQYMLNVAQNFPDVYFEHCSGYLLNDNMSNYFGRMYQMRYLSGMIAAKMSPTGKLGFVGAFNTPEVVRAINGFTLGAKAVNPKATVTVVWTNTWYDPSLERQAAVSLLDQGCDVIGQHQDTTEPAKAAIERGKYAIGYNADFGSMIGDDRVLVSTMWNWGNYMIPAVQSAIDGTWKSQSYWGGLEDDMIHLSAISPLVPAEFQKEIMALQTKLHDKKWDVFWGAIKDNTGKVRQKAGEKMSDEAMLTIDWFVEGVVGKVK